jgi:oligopeptide/dipeptide ABC transporter ATP-binding protein
LTLLTVKDLSVAIGANGPLVVDRVSFEMAPRGSFGLVGESGCGKTTLAKALLGLLPAALTIATGSIRFRETELVGLPKREMNRLRWRDIALVTQSAMNALNPVVRVGDQITEAIRAHTAIGARDASRMAEALFAQVSLEPSWTRRYPHEFSGGMRQRAIIAMALACEPALIIADEPTTALDVIIQDEVFSVLSRLRAEGGQALLLISHDLSLISENCDHVGVMYAGQIVEIGPSALVFAESAHPYTIGLRNAFPALGSEREELISIPGSPPPPMFPTPGCRFAPRCPFAQPVCHTTTPAMHAVSGGHEAACHFVPGAARFRTEGARAATWEAMEPASAIA